MSALSIQPTYPIFTDIDGQPLENGYVWIGTKNLDPQTNPINVYWDAALTIQATQPIRTLAGYPSNSGTPARLYVNSDYSIRVQNRNGSMVYSAPAATERISGLVISGDIPSTAVNFLQAGTGAQTRTAQSKMRDIVSVKDFGAVGNGVADDTAAIQACLDAVQTSSALGGTAYLPAGEYKITSTLDLPANVSLEGDGQFSIIRVYGCDGINLLASNVIGPRRVANFWLYGNGAAAFSGIVCDLASPGSRAQGMVFEGLYIAFFGTGVKGHGLWHTVFRSCTMNHVWIGFNLYDQNVKILIDDCRITHGGLTAGTGNAVGVQVGDAVSLLRPEDVQITNSIIFGFYQGIVWRSCLFGGVTNCDLDGCTIEGLRLVTADGGFTFRDNWIQVDSSTVNVYGINATSLGYTPSTGNILIQNNRIGNSTNTASLSYGILVGQNQTGIEIDNNALVGWAGVTSFRSDAAVRLKITNNTFDSGFELLNNVEPYVANNNFAGGAGFTSNTRPIFGRNQGVLTYAIGTVTMPSGGTSATATWASLGLPNALSSLSYHITTNSPIATNRNNTWADYSTTNINVYVETSVASNQPITFSVQAYQ